MPDIGTTQNSQICVRSSDGDSNDLARPYQLGGNARVLLVFSTTQRDVIYRPGPCCWLPSQCGVNRSRQTAPDRGAALCWLSRGAGETRQWSSPPVAGPTPTCRASLRRSGAVARGSSVPSPRSAASTVSASAQAATCGLAVTHRIVSECGESADLVHRPLASWKRTVRMPGAWRGPAHAGEFQALAAREALQPTSTAREPTNMPSWRNGAYRMRPAFASRYSRARWASGPVRSAGSSATGASSECDCEICGMGTVLGSRV